MDHSRAYVLVTDQFLHRANMVPVGEQVRTERMLEPVAWKPLCQSDLAHRSSHALSDSLHSCGLWEAASSIPHPGDPADLEVHAILLRRGGWQSLAALVWISIAEARLSV